METRARERWTADLAGWSVPSTLLEATGTTPPDAALCRLVEPGPVVGSEPTVTERAIAALLMSGGGSVVDVGSGPGRLTVPMARRGYRVTAVEVDPGRAEALAEATHSAGVSVTTIVGRWPDVAGNAGRHDVALGAHVAYEVPALGPFLEALQDVARRGVVLEATPRHPFAGLSRYLRLLHGHELPRRPTADDLIAVVEEVVGVEPEVQWWSAPAAPRFTDMGELLAHYRRRLLVPPERTPEVAALLAPDVHQTDAGLVLGNPEPELVTLWWRV